MVLNSPAPRTPSPPVLLSGDDRIGKCSWASWCQRAGRRLYVRAPWSISAFIPEVYFVWLCRDGKESEIKCVITDENATIDPLHAQSCKNLPLSSRCSIPAFIYWHSLQMDREIRCRMDEVATYYLSEALDVRNFDSQHDECVCCCNLSTSKLVESPGMS